MGCINIIILGGVKSSVYCGGFEHNSTQIKEKNNLFTNGIVPLAGRIHG
eukprot:UN00087